MVFESKRKKRLPGGFVLTVAVFVLDRGHLVCKKYWSLFGTAVVFVSLQDSVGCFRRENGEESILCRSLSLLVGGGI